MSPTMADKISEMSERLASMETSIEYIQKDVEYKHEQNRRSIHQLNNGQQTIIDSVTKIQMKLAVWAGAAGVITAIVIEGFRVIFK